MKKVLALLGLALSLATLSYAQGSPTNVAEVKKGIVGTWKLEQMVIPRSDTSTSRNYLRIEKNGDTFEDRQPGKWYLSGKLTVLPQNGKYIMRAHDNGELTDFTIIRLTAHQLVAKVEGSEFELSREGSNTATDTLSLLTDIDAVKTGIVGLWKKVRTVIRPEYIYLKFDSAGTVSEGQGEDEWNNPFGYKLTMEGQRCRLQVLSDDEGTFYLNGPMEQVVKELTPNRLVLESDSPFIMRWCYIRVK